MNNLQTTLEELYLAWEADRQGTEVTSEKYGISEYCLTTMIDEGRYIHNSRTPKATPQMKHTPESILEVTTAILADMLIFEAEHIKPTAKLEEDLGTD